MAHSGDSRRRTLPQQACHTARPLTHIACHPISLVDLCHGARVGSSASRSTFLAKHSNRKEPHELRTLRVRLPSLRGRFPSRYVHSPRPTALHRTPSARSRPAPCTGGTEPEDRHQPPRGSWGYQHLLATGFASRSSTHPLPTCNTFMTRSSPQRQCADWECRRGPQGRRRGSAIAGRPLSGRDSGRGRG